MKHFTDFTQRTSGSSASGLLQVVAASKQCLLLCWHAGQILALSFLHHFVALWEREAGRATLAAIGLGLVFAVVLVLALARLWEEIVEVAPRRWIAFTIPAVLAAALIGLELFRAPETEHDLTITPLTEVEEADVRIREILVAYNNSVALRELSSETGWSLQNGLLTVTEAGANPLHVRFRGRVGEQVRISFITSDPGGIARISLDGHEIQIHLKGPDRNETRARLDTGYRWGVASFAFLPLLVLTDSLAIFILLAMIWIVHELGVTGKAACKAGDGRTIRSHVASLVLVCSVALLLHSGDFLSVPLRVTKDGPSYLQGAV